MGLLPCEDLFRPETTNPNEPCGLQRRQKTFTTRQVYGIFGTKIAKSLAMDPKKDFYTYYSGIDAKN